MRMLKCAGAVLVTCLALCDAVNARAAGTYTLMCDAARSGTLTVELSGYSVAVTGAGESSETGKGAERDETKFALTVQTNSGKDYETLLSILEDGEVLRSCKLVDGQGGTGVAANDAWTQENLKAKNKSKTGKNNGSESNSGGALEWILTNASVTSVTATGGPNSTGAPTTSMQATIEAQKFSFTM